VSKLDEVYEMAFRKCNNNCISCIDDKSIEVAGPSTKDVIKKIINLKKDVKTVALTFGEPTLREDFFEIISALLENGKDVCILSNGRMFAYKDFTKKLDGFDKERISIAVTIYGHNHELHDSITRVKGSFKQTVKGIKNLLNSGMTVDVRVLINKKNCSHLKHIARFIQDNFQGLDHVIFMNMHVLGNALKNLEEVFVTYSEITPHLEQAAKHLMHNGQDVKIFHMPLCFLKPEYRGVARGITTEQKKITFLETCEHCESKKDCCGILRSYLEIAGSNEFKPIRTLPEEVKFELTSKCNLDCSFCFQVNQGNMKGRGKELTKSQVFSVIDNAAKSGMKAIRFTGGEPFLRKDLRAIAEYAKSMGLYVILNTNGTLINEDNMDVMKHVDDVLVSFHWLDGMEEKSELFKMIKSMNSKITLRACTIANKENIRHLEKFYDFFDRNQIDDWFLLRPVPNSNNRTPINVDDVGKLVEKVIDLNKKHKTKTHVANALPFCAYDPEKLSKVCVGGRNDDGHTRIIVDANGKIKPSYFIDKILGNALKDSLTESWNHRFMQKMRKLEYVPNECNECEYLMDCKGGLRFAAKMATGKIDGKDYLMRGLLPHVSVIIPTHNRKLALGLVISALLDQDYPKGKFEIIVVDDGSNDGTGNMVRELDSKHENKIKYIFQSKRNYNVSQARNLGASRASGTILVFLDNDIVVTKNFIKNHVNAQKNADVVLGYSASYGTDRAYDLDMIRDAVKQKMIEKLPVKKEFRDGFFTSDSLKSSETNENIWHIFVSNNFSIKRDIFQENNFDDSFLGWGCEDVELGYRLFKAGHKIVMDNKCLGIHIAHEKNNMYSRQKAISLLSGLAQFYKLHNKQDVRDYIIDRSIHLPTEFEHLINENKTISDILSKS
jgi:His-Xaa-Ser system radical SAM maturase HxsC